MEIDFFLGRYLSYLETHPAVLRQWLVKYSTYSDFQNVCQEFGEHYDLLEGSSLGSKANYLASILVRHGKLRNKILLLHENNPERVEELAFFLEKRNLKITPDNFPHKNSVPKKNLNSESNMIVKSKLRYNFALSFAGEDRKYASRLRELLEEKGCKVFYDFGEQAEIIGENFFQLSQKIYKDNSQFCVILVSENYAKKKWTKIELEHAQARKLEQSNYIIPILLDDTDIPGINKTIGACDLRKNSPNKLSLEEIAELLVQKISGLEESQP